MCVGPLSQEIRGISEGAESGTIESAGPSDQSVDI